MMFPALVGSTFLRGRWTRRAVQTPESRHTSINSRGLGASCEYCPERSEVFTSGPSIERAEFWNTSGCCLIALAC